MVNTPVIIALVGVAGTVLGAFVNGALATRAKVNDEMRQLRLRSYPLLWQLTSSFSRWPRMTNTYSDLDELHRWLRSWYYEAGGIHLSENSRARYGEVQELVAAHLGGPGGEAIAAGPPGPISGDVYIGLLGACSALRTALTEDLESRRQRLLLFNIILAVRHLKQKWKAAKRLAKAKQRWSVPGSNR